MKILFFCYRFSFPIDRGGKIPRSNSHVIWQAKRSHTC